jgi:hypothetical protein
VAQLYIDFEWWRDAKGYRMIVAEPPKQPQQIKWGKSTALSAGQDAFATGVIMSATGDILQTTSVILPETLLRTNAEKLGHRIVRSGGNLIPYRPLSDFDGLFRLFANAAPTPEGMLDFIDKFGPLTRDGLDEEHGENASRLIEQTEAMSRILDLYSRGQKAGLAQILGVEGIKLPEIVTTLISDPATRSLRLQLSVVDLLAGMWLQLGQTLSSGATIRRCAQCGMLFEAGPGTGRRLDAKFCSDDHRITFNSQKRQGK